VALTLESGERQSKLGWGRIFREVRRRGLRALRFLVAYGQLGISAALGGISPEYGDRRCWNRNLLNVPDSLPRRLEAEGNELFRRIAYADTQACAERPGKSHPKAVGTLKRD